MSNCIGLLRLVVLRNQISNALLKQRPRREVTSPKFSFGLVTAIIREEVFVARQSFGDIKLVPTLMESCDVFAGCRVPDKEFLIIEFIFVDEFDQNIKIREVINGVLPAEIISNQNH